MPLGAAQRLSNGNYSFTLGINGPEPPRPPAHLVEVTPDGTKVYDLQVNKTEYRSYRMRTLYEGDRRRAGWGTPDGRERRRQRRLRAAVDGQPDHRHLRRGRDPRPRGDRAAPAGRQPGGLRGSASRCVGGKTVAVLTFAGSGVRRRLAGGRQLHADESGQTGSTTAGVESWTATATAQRGANHSDAFFRLYR